MMRRAFLKLGGVGATAGFLPTRSNDVDASEHLPPPDVPADALERNGWRLQEDSIEEVFEERFGIVTVTATAHTRVYADERLARDLEEKTMGAVETSPNRFFASRLTFDPDIDNVPRGVGQKELTETVQSHADRSLRDRMKEAGLEDVTGVGTTEIAMETGEVVEVTQYEATYAYDPFAYRVKEVTVTIPGDELSVTTWLAVWNHGGDTLIAGGGHPAENVAFTETEGLTEAVTVVIDVDLDLTPQQYRDEILRYIAAVR